MRNFIGICSVAVLFTLAACEEVPPAINYEISKQLNDTTYITDTVLVAQPKNVLLEDVSGVQCVNCPDAAIISKEIMDAHPDRVYSVVMHPRIDALKSFVNPVNKEGYKSKYDFRTQDAADILNQCGVPGSLPRGLVDRTLFSGKTERLLGREEWAAKCDVQLQQTTPVNIELENTFNEATRNGVIKIKLTYTKAVSNKHLMSIAIIEDSIIDVQEYQDPQTFEVKFDTKYPHMHVLRDMVTFATGDQLTNKEEVTLTAGRVFEKEYAYTLDVSDQIKVDPKHAKILVFVHEAVPQLNVVHVKEIHVKE